jgi:FG-GAP-like repeat/FG-GAP repeat
MRKVLKAGVLCVCVAGLSGCAATTDPASNVGSTTATLNAQGRTDSTPGHFEFQYAKSPGALGTASGQQTPTSGPIPPDTPGGGKLAAFGEGVTGLTPGTTYFYRICGGDGQAQGDVCAQVRSFTTTVAGATVAFAPPVDYPVHSAPAAVAVADLQGLGDTDLVSANPSTNDVSVLLNSGYGTFAPAANYRAGTSPVALAVGDFTGGGEDDVVAAGGTSVSVLLGRGDGTLSPGVNYALPGTPQSVVVGDFTGDGKPDIAVFEIDSSTGNAEVSVLPGHGDGSFGSPITTVVAAGGQQGTQFIKFVNGTLVAGKFDQTGRLDLAVAGSETQTSQAIQNFPQAFGAVLLNTGSGSFSVSQLGIGSHFSGLESSQVYGLAAAPLTASSSPLDLYYVNDEESVVGGTPEGGTWAYRNPGNGDGTFGSAQTIATLQPQSATPTTITNVTLALGHVSSSVNNDLAISDPAQGLVIVPSNGDGTFGAPIRINSVSASQGLTAGDLNGDGRADVAVGAPGGAAQVAVLMNASPGG